MKRRLAFAWMVTVALLWAVAGCQGGQTTQADIDNQISEIGKQDSGGPSVDPGNDMMMMGGRGGAQAPVPDQAAPGASPQ